VGKYDSYSKEQLVSLLERRDRERRFGLVWERDEIEADAALNDDFVAFDPDPNQAAMRGERWSQRRGAPRRTFAPTRASSCSAVTL
jgi:hypothetical protein